MLLVFGNQLINTEPVRRRPVLAAALHLRAVQASATRPSYDRAWAAALVLIAFVMILNLVARGIARWKAPQEPAR